MGKGGEIFVFDMGSSVKIVDLAKKMIRLAGFIPGKDIKIEFTGLRPGEKLYEELLNNTENSLPTYNEKIMIAKVREYDFETVSGQIDSRSEEHTSELQSLMRISYAVFCLKKKKKPQIDNEKTK